MFEDQNVIPLTTNAIAVTARETDAARGKLGLREQRETRERIVRAAHDCLVRDGYERITTRRIAEEAGVNIATLHYHFGNKEALLAEATRQGSRRTEQALRAVVDAAPDAASALVAALHETWNVVRQRPGVLRYDLVVRGFRDTEAHDEVVAIYAMYRRLTGEILQRHVNGGGQLPEGMTVADLAQHIVAVVDGVVLQYAVMRDEAAAQFSLELIARQTLELMGSRDTARDAEGTVLDHGKEQA